jgi:hypothetical protein
VQVLVEVQVLVQALVQALELGSGLVLAEHNHSKSNRIPVQLLLELVIIFS